MPVNWMKDFLEGLKTTFQGREIEMVVSEVDETEYLLKSAKQRAELGSAVIKGLC